LAIIHNSGNTGTNKVGFSHNGMKMPLNAHERKYWEQYQDSVCKSLVISLECKEGARYDRTLNTGNLLGCDMENVGIKRIMYAEN